MCLIIISQPTCPSVSTAWLRDIISFNGDGLGFTYHDPITRKTTASKVLAGEDKMIAEYRRVEALGVPFIMHARMATHGLTNEFNVHPYNVAEGFEVSHNGILALGYQGGDKTISDTAHYVDNQLRPLLAAVGEDGIACPAILDIMGAAIGNNRFAWMDSTGRISVVNEQQWHDWEGLLLSNTYAISDHKGISPTAGPAPVEYKTWGGWKGKSGGYASMDGGSGKSHGIYDMYGDAYWGDSKYSGSIASITTKRLSPKGDIIDADYIKDAIDLQVEAEECALREAEDAAEPLMSWADFIDVIETKYDTNTAQATEFVYGYIIENYTPAEIAGVEIDLYALAKWLFESDACALADLLADMDEGYELEILLNAKIAHPALSLVR